MASVVVVLMLVGGAFALVGLSSAGAVAAHAGVAKSPGFVPISAFGTTKVKSTNWAGYAVVTTSGAVSYVVGSWIQPGEHGTCPSATQYASFWVGIDGYGSSTVEQTGTLLECFGSVAYYSAWYEFYPAGPVYFSFAIHPGDHITASVKYASGSFTTTLKDVTTGKSGSHTQKLSSALRLSAEWIAEAPSSSSGVLPLAHFNTVTFTGCKATISGSTKVIGGFNNRQITMVNGAIVKALPSALLSSGSSFTATWKHS